jgi:hypothetical protein
MHILMPRNRRERGTRISANAAEQCPLRVSKADLTARKSDFRSTAKSGLRADIAPCPFGAQPDSCGAANSHLFDHLVGGSEQRRWNCQGEHSCSLEVDNQIELGRLQDR